MSSVFTSTDLVQSIAQFCIDESSIYFISHIWWRCVRRLLRRKEYGEWRFEERVFGAALRLWLGYNVKEPYAIAIHRLGRLRFGLEHTPQVCSEYFDIQGTPNNKDLLEFHNNLIDGIRMMWGSSNSDSVYPKLSKQISLSMQQTAIFKWYTLSAPLPEWDQASVEELWTPTLVVSEACSNSDALTLLIGDLLEDEVNDVNIVDDLDDDRDYGDYYEWGEQQWERQKLAEIDSNVYRSAPTNTATTIIANPYNEEYKDNYSNSVEGVVGGTIVHERIREWYKWRGRFNEARAKRPNVSAGDADDTGDSLHELMKTMMMSGFFDGVENCDDAHVGFLAYDIQVNQREYQRLQNSQNPQQLQTQYSDSVDI